VPCIEAADRLTEFVICPDHTCDEDRFIAPYQLSFLDKVEHKRGFKLKIKLKQETVRYFAARQGDVVRKVGGL
jgi:hypothetical protein